MQTILISNGTKEQRDAKLKALLSSLAIAPYDQTWIEVENPGIDTIRLIKHSLILKSTSSSRAIILKNFDKSTIEAQNALLKTLEEPPLLTYIFLLAASVSSILPTILSRTNIINLVTSSYHHTPLPAQDPLNLIQKSCGEKILLAQTYAKDKTEVSNYLISAIAILRSYLIGYYERSQPKISISPLLLTQLIRRFETARTFLDYNINPRLTLEVLFFGVK